MEQEYILEGWGEGQDREVHLWLWRKGGHDTFHHNNGSGCCLPGRKQASNCRKQVVASSLKGTCYIKGFCYISTKQRKPLFTQPPISLLQYWRVRLCFLVGKPWTQHLGQNPLVPTLYDKLPNIYKTICHMSHCKLSNKTQSHNQKLTRGFISIEFSLWQKCHTAYFQVQTSVSALPLLP